MSEASRWRRAALSVVCLGLLSALGTPRADGAVASHVSIEIVGSAEGFTPHPSVALIDTSGLVPGAATAGTMGVRSDFTAPSELSVQLIDIANDDNGCTHAERTVDHTCGRGQGDLGAALVFTLAVSIGEQGRYVPAWTGRAAQLAKGIAVARSIAPGATRWVRLVARLPLAAGNQVQTDTIAFGVRVIVRTESGTQSVDLGGGSGAERGSGSAVARASGSAGAGSRSHGLAFTGTPVELLLSAGVLLVAGGVVLTVSARTRRRGSSTRRSGS